MIESISFLLGGEMMGHSSFNSFDIFLAFLTGILMILLVFFGVITSLLATLGLGAIVGLILNFIVGLLGILAVLIFGFCILKKAWYSCFR
jgi:hypothetical protein